MCFGVAATARGGLGRPASDQNMDDKVDYKVIVCKAYSVHGLGPKGFWLSK